MVRDPGQQGRHTRRVPSTSTSSSRSTRRRTPRTSPRCATGGYLLYDSSWPLDDKLIREGITILGIPFGKLCVENFEGDRNRTLLRNIVYVGALAALLEFDMDVVNEMLREKFAKKRALLDANFRAIRLGFDYAKANYDCPLPFHLERMGGDKTKDSILIDGNAAGALGAVFAGATVGAWYPITPSTSLMEAFKEYCERFRVDPTTGERKYALIQAEDELAAAGMVIGAGWAGARAFTSTAGPGISLMSEFIGLAYYTEIPGVFFDIQRTGPSTGMPTRTQQGDLLSIAYLSHGDTKHIALFPANPGECFTLAVEAFDLAERFQTPVFVVSDLDIGMNDWMCPRFTWDDNYRPDRGKVLGPAELERVEKFSRYLDVDGDGIAAQDDPGCLTARRLFHARLGAHEVRHLHRRRGRVSGSRRSVGEEDGDRRQGGARPGDSFRRQDDRRGDHLARRLSCGGTGGGRQIEGWTGGRVDRWTAGGRLHAHSRVSVWAGVREFIEAHPRCYVVEQNRDGATAFAARARDRHCARPDDLRARLRRPSAHRRSRRRRHRRQEDTPSRTRTDAPRSRARLRTLLHDINSETGGSPPFSPEKFTRADEARLRRRDVDALRRLRA